MSKERDPLGLSTHWHVDLRLVAELPEDNIVGTRFIINASFGVVALAALLYASWLGKQHSYLKEEISRWDGLQGDKRAEVAEIKFMQREYAVEAAKIDQAHALVKPALFVSGFIADLGRTRPEQVVIDSIDSSEAGIVVRGNVRENSQRATRLLGNYAKQLSSDPKIGPLFQQIVLTSLDRGSNTEEVLNFELAFRAKVARP